MKSYSNIMKLSIPVILVSSLLNILTFSQEHFTDNYPLKVGNAFTYKIHSFAGPYSSSYRMKTVIKKDTIINNKTYYLMVTYGYSPPDTSLNRVDSLNGNLLIFNANACPPYFQEMLIDSLWSMKNDTAKKCGTGKIVCIDTGGKNIWGMNLSYKKFYQFYQSGAGYSTEERTYIKGLGLVYGFSSYNGPPMGTGRNDTLIGCVINGILFGDTSLVIGIVKISDKVPSEFCLYQNYPNPFNPYTIIKLDSYRAGPVSLYIYDILGRELYSAVNQILTIGTHEFNWDSRNYASGVYICRVTAEGFTGSIKMILSK